MGAAMNRGKRKTFVTVALIVLALVAAVLIDVIDGATGGASTPEQLVEGRERPDWARARRPRAAPRVAQAQVGTVGQLPHRRH